MTTKAKREPDRMVQPVGRRCVAPAAFLLVGLWGVTWMAQPGHVPSNVDQVNAALQHLHPTGGHADALADGPPLTPAERSVQVAGKFAGAGYVSIAFSLLSLLFGVLAGPAPRRWLFRLHRWSRFVALCTTGALALGTVVELDADLVIVVAGVVPLGLLISIATGLVRPFGRRWTTTGAAPRKPGSRRVRR
ncbi:MAG: hypothetical protein ACRYHQ_26550 [Janthinobacterium lividum]